MDDLTPFSTDPLQPDLSLNVSTSLDTTGLSTLENVSVATSSDVAQTTDFNWGSLANTVASLFSSAAKVEIAGQAEKNAIPGQVISGQVAVAQSQAQQSTNLMITVGIIAGVTVITIIALNKDKK